MDVLLMLPGSWQGELGIIMEADAKGVHEFIRRLEAGKERGDRANENEQDRANASMNADRPGSSRSAS
jgi:hypothetical protein